ncbi:MAG: hypothetical protein J5835_06535 [Bacteroidales bacterium]|nr:hypothetical protein [Bacteroidales bacterium]
MSNSLKAILVEKNIQGQTTINESECLTVQHFSYTCRRRRNDAGLPYGSTLPSYLDFTIKVTSNNNGKGLLNHMSKNEPFQYSFIFNATFTDNVLSKYEDLLLATGYIVDVEETYENFVLTDKTVNQTLIHARLLLCNITYVGNGDIASYLNVTND